MSIWRRLLRLRGGGRCRGRAQPRGLELALQVRDLSTQSFDLRLQIIYTTPFCPETPVVVVFGSSGPIPARLLSSLRQRQRLHAQRERGSPIPASLGSPRELEGPATAPLWLGAPRKPCRQPREEAGPGEIEGRGCRPGNVSDELGQTLRQKRLEPKWLITDPPTPHPLPGGQPPTSPPTLSHPPATHTLKR